MLARAADVGAARRRHVRGDPPQHRPRRGRRRAGRPARPRAVRRRVASRAMVLFVVFPGSFVLSFTYSEATLIVLAAACLLFLLREQWWLAGIAAMLGTATRPNGVGARRGLRRGQLPRHPPVAGLELARGGRPLPHRVRRLPAVRRSHGRRARRLVPGAERGVEGGHELRGHRGDEHVRVPHPSVLVADRCAHRAVDGRARGDDLVRVARPAVASARLPTARSWSP